MGRRHMITFHKSSLKLASLYLAIILAISLFFSATIYQVSVSELGHGLRRPLPAFEGPGLPNYIRDQLLEERVESYNQARDKIVTRLILINVVILALGGCLSYYLALRTLKPIEDAHEAQRTFAASASHELRTPITAMRSENEVALMDPNLSLKDAKQQLQSNIEELEKLTTLAEGLLQLAQAEGAHNIQEEVPIKDVLSVAIERLAPIAKKKGITIDSNKTNKLKVYSNRAALTEILVVLLDNAIKYSPENSIVSISITDSSNQVAVHIKDTGLGIAEDHIDHIFTRFYRADQSRTKQATEGYGLGLAIAAELAKSNNAQLSVESMIGKGSTFTLAIPKQ
jgi:two-component system sensor histidine kinase CiaH